MHQIARFKKILEEACPRTPLANAWLCHAPYAALRMQLSQLPKSWTSLGKSCTVIIIVYFTVLNCNFYSTLLQGRFSPLCCKRIDALVVFEFPAQHLQ